MSAKRRTGTRGRKVAAARPLRYIESSALLAALLEQDESALQALREDGERVTSALTFAETARALVRARLAERISVSDEQACLRAIDQVRRRCAVAAVTDAVLLRAGRPFPQEPIRTLDAIHLATVDLFGEAPQLVTVVSRDQRVRANARALGYALA
jgi:predicted nucleic acid-binding protein